MTIRSAASSDRPTLARQIRRLFSLGVTALLIGAALVSVTLLHSTGSPAYADTTPYELYCPGTPIGDIVLNDVVTAGVITPTTPTAGQQFNLSNFQSVLNLPSSIVSAAAAIGNSAITGTAQLTVDASGATPATMPSGNLAINAPIPSPVPAAGLTLELPATAGTLGPFTATADSITLSVDSTVSLTITVSGSNLNLACSAYPDNSEPTGIASTAPSGAPIDPVIAESGSTGVTTTGAPPTTTPATSLTGAYELYCPGTPLGDLALNDVTTVASVDPSAPSSGETFNVTGYQTTVSLPQSLASAAEALSPTLSGSATGQVDVSGATPATLSTGTENFSLTIPNPVPAAGVTLTVPQTPLTLGPFTATGSELTVQQDASTSLTLELNGSPLTLTCTAYANDSVASGIVTKGPTGNPIAPVLSVAGGTTPTTTGGATTTTSGTGATTTTVPVSTSGTAPYELYCPGTPVGNIVLNNVVTDGSLSPSSPTPGQTFDLTGFQSTLNLPGAIVSAAAALGNSSITGTAQLNVDATGATPASLSSGDLAINAPIPNPVPASGLTLELPATPGTVGPFTATAGAIALSVDPSINLTINVSGSNLSLTCNPYPNDSDPSGITSASPPGNPASPVIATTSSGPPPTTTTTSGSTTSTTSATGVTGPVSAPPGGTVPISGSGFQPGEMVDIVLDTSPPVTLGVTEADSSGDISTPVTVPTTTPDGTYTITATGETSGRVGSVSLTVASTAGTTTTTTATTTGPPLTTSAGSGPVQAGTSLTVAGAGFDAGETVDFALFSTRVDLGTGMADSSGDVTKTVAIPASLPAGTHMITATGETSGVVDTVSFTVTAPTSTTTTGGAPTTGATTHPTSATTAVANVMPAVSSRSLAFTGIGSPLRWIALAGAVLVMLAGVVLLGMASRRAVILLAAPGASLPVSRRDRLAGLGMRRVGEARRVSSWLLGRQR